MSDGRGAASGWARRAAKALAADEPYDGSREGTLQGGGTAGGLGLDAEFFESVLVPQVMLEGFLGFLRLLQA